MFGNWYDQIYFSYFSNCEEIKLWKAPAEKNCILSYATIVANERNILMYVHILYLYETCCATQ